ncbi:MAG: type IV toxin-antitoxin system AbiEi family antitoxin domain-containing protein [Pseudonocardiaceae bacterium]
MSRGRSLAALSPLAAEQWGMVTAAQARTLQVSRVDLNRLVQDGTLERVETAARVYRLTGSPPDPDLDDLRAAWLQLGEGVATARRLREPDVVVSHRSAAAALDVGDLLADVHEFYSLVRRRLRRSDVRIRVRPDLPVGTWRVVRGLPVTTAAQVVSDLLADREDESAIARIVQDALRAGLLTRAELDEIVADEVAAYGASSPAALSATLAGIRG